jgi:hypothetical protein
MADRNEHPCRSCGSRLHHEEECPYCRACGDRLPYDGHVVTKHCDRCLGRAGAELDGLPEPVLDAIHLLRSRCDGESDYEIEETILALTRRVRAMSQAHEAQHVRYLLLEGALRECKRQRDAARDVCEAVESPADEPQDEVAIAAALDISDDGLDTWSGRCRILLARLRGLRDLLRETQRDRDQTRALLARTRDGLRAILQDGIG